MQFVYKVNAKIIQHVLEQCSNLKELIDKSLYIPGDNTVTN